MRNFIEQIVSRFPNSLEFKPNKGEDRVRNHKYKGSLWIKRRFDGFRLQTTSDLASILDSEIEKIAGSPVGAQKIQQYKYWYVDDYQKVEKIIESLGNA